MSNMFSAQNVIEAEFRIRRHVRETPVDHSLHLSRLGNGDVYLKLEHLQHTHVGADAQDARFDELAVRATSRLLP